MDWPRVKTLLIVLLLVINLVLAWLYIQRQWTADKERDLARQAWQNTLASMNVTLDDALFAQMETQAYALYLPRQKEREEDLARYFLGEAIFSDLGGSVYEYAGRTGTARFRAGSSFEIRLDNPVPMRRKTPLEQTKADLAAAGLDAYPLTGFSESQGEGWHEITCRQRVQGHAVYNASLTFFYGENGLQSVGGVFLLSQASMQEPQPSLTVGSLLMQWARSREAPAHVRDVELGYVLTADGPDLWKLQPVCKIVTGGGEFLLDADTGLMMAGDLEKLTNL